MGDEDRIILLEITQIREFSHTSEDLKKRLKIGRLKYQPKSCADQNDPD